jgi:hypothetical protein
MAELKAQTDGYLVCNLSNQVSEVYKSLDNAFVFFGALDMEIDVYLLKIIVLNLTIGDFASDQIELLKEYLKRSYGGECPVVGIIRTLQEYLFNQEGDRQANGIFTSQEIEWREDALIMLTYLMRYFVDEKAWAGRLAVSFFDEYSDSEIAFINLYLIHRVSKGYTNTELWNSLNSAQGHFLNWEKEIRYGESILLR